MKIIERVKIDLGNIIMQDEWQDCYLLLRKSQIPEVEEFSRNESAINARSERLTMKIKQLEWDIITAENKEEISKEIRKLKKELAEMPFKILDLVQNYVKDRFISGIGFDEETKTKVAFTKEDISQFSANTLSEVVQRMAGQQEKKA